MTDMFGVVGILAYDCTYDDGQTQTGSKSSGIEADLLAAAGVE